jgi:hypothetical protein
MTDSMSFFQYFSPINSILFVQKRKRNKIRGCDHLLVEEKRWSSSQLNKSSRDELLVQKGCKNEKFYFKIISRGL